eukprot:4287225-Pyramimonas_sp.AAC.1
MEAEAEEKVGQWVPDCCTYLPELFGIQGVVEFLQIPQHFAPGKTLQRDDLQPSLPEEGRSETAGSRYCFIPELHVLFRP